MRKAAICFTRRGAEVVERINEAYRARAMTPARAYACMDPARVPDGFCRVSVPVTEWMREQFVAGSVILCIGAAGIAVRALNGVAADKLTDSPVIVIDDHARFVIPLLSGHAGGANKIALTLAAMLGAVPVITTATDVSGAFSADTFAAENRLSIANRDGIRKVSAKALEGKGITLSIRDYPPQEAVDIVVADETDAEYSLLLKPKKYTVGLGMKRGTGESDLERFFLDTLEDTGIGPDDIYALCTIDLKAEEPALVHLRDRYRIPLLCFDSALLAKAGGSFASSQFVLQTTGVDNVCERSAVLGAGVHAALTVPKRCRKGMTIAVAERCRGRQGIEAERERAGERTQTGRDGE